MGKIKYSTADIERVLEKADNDDREITVDSSLSTTSTNPVQNKVVTEELSNKVDKEEGKGLSTKDYTDEDKEKVGHILNDSSIDEFASYGSHFGNAIIPQMFLPNLIEPLDARGFAASYQDAGTWGKQVAVFFGATSGNGAVEDAKLLIGIIDEMQDYKIYYIEDYFHDIATQSEIDALFDNGTSGGGSTSY